MVADQSAQVRSGKVSLSGQTLLADPSADLRCGDGVALPKPGDSPTLEPSPSEAPPSVLPSPSLSPAPSPAPSLSPGATPTPRRTPTPTPTRTPTRGPTASPTPSPTRSLPPPPPPTKPVLQRATASPGTVAQIAPSGAPCTDFPTSVTAGALVTEEGYTASQFKVSGRYTVPGGSRHSFGLTLNGTRWTGGFSSPNSSEASDNGGTISITITATDPKGDSASVSLSVKLDGCVIIT
jgi:putative peptide zinc metalloprotease protein